MAEITNVVQLKNYIKTVLGYPTINIEVDDVIIEQVIEDTVQDFHRYNYTEASYLDWFIFITSGGVSEYPLSGIKKTGTNEVVDDIEAVYDFSVSFGYDGINTLFSPTHILLYNQWVEQGGYPGGPSYNTSTPGMVLADWQIAQNYMSMVNEMVGKMYTFTLLPNKRIRVMPTPNETSLGVLGVYRRVDAMYLYNHPIIKKLCVARTKKVWGSILSKFSGSLPDGLTINGEAIHSEGVAEEEKWLEEMRLESQPNDFFMA
jgi:hypothetical protein